MTSIRTVDSWMQTVDRLIICRLKEYHYSKDNRTEDAGYAKEQAEELSEMATRYLEECLSVDREPRVHRHLRYHRHGTEEIQVSSIMDAVSQLAACHAEYWRMQGEVIRLRTECNLAEVYVELTEAQMVLDSCNQRRNELIQKGDDLLLRIWQQRKASMS